MRWLTSPVPLVIETDIPGFNSSKVRSCMWTARCRFYRRHCAGGSQGGAGSEGGQSPRANLAYPFSPEGAMFHALRSRTDDG